MRWIWLVGMMLSAALVACSSSTASEPSAVATTAAIPSATVLAVASPSAVAIAASPSSRTPLAVGTPGVPSDALPLVGRAKQDVATRASVSVDQVQVVGVTRVAWPDSSLGCPKPGQMYSQIVTPGYKIVLQAGGTTYEYHTDLTQRVIACTK